jgi:uncharacterized protein with PIN domain
MIHAMAEVRLRVYGPLNDFLPPDNRQTAIAVRFAASRSVKDLVESAGVPHTEVDLLLVNDESAPFDRAVRDGDRVAAFPRFFAIDVAPLTRVRPPDLQPVRFVLDGHLGALARRLRLVGLDAICPPDADDERLAAISALEHRILLTRDRGLLKRRLVTRGAFVRARVPHDQLLEVLARYGPLDLDPLTRCLRCNGHLREVSKAEVESLLPPRTRQEHVRFSRCDRCGRVYWQGAHWPRLRRAIEAAIAVTRPPFP